MSTLDWHSAKSHQSQLGLLLSSDSAMSRFGEGGSDPFLRRKHFKTSFGQLCA
jgi:hypothetical protein